MYRQVLDPVADSLGWSSLFAALPLISTVRAARCAADAGLGRRAAVPARRDHRRGVRLSDAVRPGDPRGDRGCGIRVLPDPLDRDQRDLDLQHDRRDRALRRAAPVVHLGERRPAGPGDHHRVLLRRAAGGAGRLRHAGRDHLGHAHRARLPAAEGRGRWRWSPTPRRSRSARWPPRSSRCPRSPPSTRTTSAGWSAGRPRCWRCSCR